MSAASPLAGKRRIAVLTVLAAILLPTLAAQTTYEKRAGLSVREILAGQGGARAEAKLVRAAMDANLLDRWSYGYDSVVLLAADDLPADARSRELLGHWTCFALNDSFPIYCGVQSSIFAQWRTSRDEGQRRNIVATLSVILAHEQCHPAGCNEQEADARAYRQIELLLKKNRIDGDMANFLRDYLRRSAERNEQEANGVMLRTRAPKR